MSHLQINLILFSITGKVIEEGGLDKGVSRKLSVCSASEELPIVGREVACLHAVCYLEWKPI